jgi:3-dehydroquinate synthase
VTTTRIPVRGPSTYDVVVGHTAMDEVETLCQDAAAVMVVSDPAAAQYAGTVTDTLHQAGKRVVTWTLPSGEAAKSLDAVAALWDRLGETEVSRSDAVVAVGGGATTDLAGFVAATWLRGIRLVNVPTTLLGMVDAAVGGKTGINTAAGKNLVGAFHPPVGVLVDLDVLATLPEDQWVNGMAEVVKAGLIADPVILDVIDDDPPAARLPTGRHARELIERAIRVKADVVSRDLREAGPREALNYGHTLGHAIERVSQYGVPHGHAISVGMVFAAELGRRVNGLDDTTADRHAAVLDQIGLPTTYRGDVWPDLVAAMRVDKKSRGGRLRFVVLDALASPTILEAPADDDLAAAYATVTA